MSVSALSPGKKSIGDLTSSGDSRLSRPPVGLGETAAVALALASLITVFAWWLFARGYLLYYGDAQAHLNISRSIIDSRTPGYDQLGVVWLPMLHVICLPFVGNNWLWTTGLAATIPVGLCFIVAGTCFYLAAREAYGSVSSAIVVAACFALNPNVLYLAAIPMTEAVFLAGLAVALLAMLRFAATGSLGYIALGVGASWFMSLTRYDGWFLIPFIGIGFALFAKERRWLVLIGFGLAASLAPLYWVAHNRWETGNPLDFFNGPYSALAIQGGKDYRGYHDWLQAAQYYFTAGRLCAGPTLIVLGALGLACAIAKRRALPCLFLLLTPAFYVWSMHSSHSTPIHIPTLWPFSYYNTRYGIAVAVAAAFSVGALVDVLPRPRFTTVLLPLLAVLPWLWHLSPEHWICWQESNQNSLSRRAWTSDAAEYLRQHYTPGTGILTGFGDLTGIYCRANIPLVETLHEGNGPAWLVATSLAADYHPAQWAVAQSGDHVSKALQACNPPTYKLVHEVETKDAPTLEIYRRIR